MKTRNVFQKLNGGNKVSESEKQQLMRDYWLGRLSEAEADDCELEWFSRDADALLLESVRDDLIDEFLAEWLSAGEKLLFEKNFLVVPTNLRDVAVVKAYRQTIDKKKVESFLPPPVASTVTNSSESRKSFWQTLFATSNLAFAVVALLIVAGTFAVWQSGRKSPAEIAKTENLNSPVPTPPNFDVSDNQNQGNVNNNGSANSNVGNSKRENEAVNSPKKNPQRESDPVKPQQLPKTAKRPTVPQQQIVQNQILMGESSGAGCVLQINNSSKSVSVALLNGEKPTAMEIKLAGEQNPLLILPVKIKTGQKILSVTFPVKELEQGKKYRFTLLEGDRRRNLNVCEVNKINP